MSFRGCKSDTFEWHDGKKIKKYTGLRKEFRGWKSVVHSQRKKKPSLKATPTEGKPTTQKIHRKGALNTHFETKENATHKNLTWDLNV